MFISSRHMEILTQSKLLATCAIADHSKYFVRKLSDPQLLDHEDPFLRRHVTKSRSARLLAQYGLDCLRGVVDRSQGRQYRQLQPSADFLPLAAQRDVDERHSLGYFKRHGLLRRISE